MPSMQDKVDLISWVEGLPNREHLGNYAAVLRECAERYGNTDAHLAMVLNVYTEMFRKSMTQNIKDYSKAHSGELPAPSELNPIFDRVLEALLLRMWTYANEYYQRYRADDVFQPITDDVIGLLLSQAETDVQPHETNDDTKED